MASKIKVDQLETADGSGTIALQNQLSGMTTTSLPTGSVLQVVQTLWSTAAGTTVGTTWTDLTDLNTTITPLSTSSKIYATYSVNLGSVTNNKGGLRLIRGSTPIGVATSYGSRTAACSSFQGYSNNNQMNYVFSFLDSPSTTSATTYKVQFYNSTTGQITFNYGYDNANNSGIFRTSSTLTLMEIAG